LRYNQALPGTAERIIAMAEREQMHRHSQEKRRAEGELRAVLVGQLLAGAIGLSGVASGFVLVLKDKPVSGFAALITSLGALVGLYFWNLHQRGKQSQPAKSDTPQGGGKVRNDTGD
jgi:uncharacterized membrane protein